MMKMAFFLLLVLGYFQWSYALLKAPKHYENDFTKGTSILLSVNLTAWSVESAYFRTNCLAYREFYSCCDLYLIGQLKSGVRVVRNKTVYCDMETNGGGWLVVFNRSLIDNDTQINFSQGWNQYWMGFGAVNGDHWLGLNFLHQFTHNYSTQLQIELWNTTKKITRLTYENFKIANETHHYQLFLEGYSGPLPDELYYHNGSYFSTYDQNHDLPTQYCSSIYRGGWWYNDCWNVLPTGTDGFIYWGQLAFKGMAMKIRPTTCNLFC